MYMFCENDKLYLRPLILKDSDFIYALREKNKNFILNYAEVSRNAQKEKIKNSISKDDEIYLLITLKETSSHIGYIHSKFFNNGKIADIDFVITDNNSKLIKEALILFRTELFKQGCIRLECNICSSNLLAKEILEDLNFNLEGIKKMSYFNNDNFFDILVFASLNC
ncbi:GNAT family N-acetyltransferase [Clostridium senegalense]